MPFHFTDFTGPEECFTWRDPETGKCYHFAVARLRKALLDAGIPPMDAIIPPGHDKFLVEKRAVDPERAMSMTEEERDTPVIAALFDNHMVLIDGSHRMYRLIQDGKQDVKAWVLSEDIWGDYLILGLPDMTDEQIADLPVGDLPQRRKPSNG